MLRTQENLNHIEARKTRCSVPGHYLRHPAACLALRVVGRGPLAETNHAVSHHYTFTVTFTDNDTESMEPMSYTGVLHTGDMCSKLCSIYLYICLYLWLVLIILVYWHHGYPCCFVLSYVMICECSKCLSRRVEEYFDYHGWYVQAVSVSVSVYLLHRYST